MPSTMAIGMATNMHWTIYRPKVLALCMVYLFPLSMAAAALMVMQ